MMSPIKKHDRDVLTRKIKASKKEKDEKKLIEPKEVAVSFSGKDTPWLDWIKK